MTFIDACGRPWKLCPWKEENPDRDPNQNGEALWVFYWVARGVWLPLQQATEKTEGVMAAEMTRMPPFTVDLYDALSFLHR